jgi:hypothetical protein
MNASAGLVRSGATKQRQWVAEGLKTLFFRPPHADPNRNRSTSIAECRHSAWNRQLQRTESI